MTLIKARQETYGMVLCYCKFLTSVLIAAAYYYGTIWLKDVLCCHLFHSTSAKFMEKNAKMVRTALCYFSAIFLLAAFDESIY